MWLLSWRGVVDIIWLFFLLFLLYYFGRERQILQAASYWLITKGHITRLEWVQEGVHVWPKIEYTYHLYDQKFHGEYLFLDTIRNNPNSKYARKLAYRVAMAFKNNEEISVFYNPDNPLQSALDVRIPVKLNVILGLLLFLLLLHLGMIWHHLYW